MVILGAGGHASEVLDVLIQNGNEALEGLLLFDNVNADVTKHNIPILKNIDDLKQAFKTDNRFVIATGNPVVRQKLDLMATQAGGVCTALIANNAKISSMDVKIGDGVNIMQDVIIFPSVAIGKGVLINARALVHHNSTIGAYSEIGPGSIITGNCFLGERVQLGAGCVLLPNVSIADDVVIGAGTTVTKSINETGVYIGTAHKRLR